MFIYSGYGIILSVADEGQDRIIDAFNMVYKTNASSVEEIDDTMLLGDYESSDNINFAIFDDEEVNTEEGIFIIDMSKNSPFTEEGQRNITEILQELGYNDAYHYAYYEVECEQ